MNIYLDYAATTPLSDEMKQYLTGLLNVYGNPSTMYSIGEQAKAMIDNTRQAVAAFINTDAGNIYFTGGGSAANTLAIKGFFSKHPCHLLYSPIAHKSILKCVENHKNNYPLKTDAEGFIDLSDLELHLGAAEMQPFVIVDYANSEIGTVQNIKEITRLVHLHDGILFLDCTGSISTIPLDVTEPDVDMCAFSAHKLGGLKGCGVLYKRPEITLEPLVYGNQEQGLIGGTENILGIASLGKAIEHYDYASISSENRDYVYQYISRYIPDSYLIGSPVNRLPHNLYMCFQGVNGESLMILLDMHGIQVSTGSACNSKSLTPSAALSAIGVKKEDIHSCIRMTFSGSETREQLDYVCKQLSLCVGILRELNQKELQL